MNTFDNATTLRIVQLGLGGVGQALVRQYIALARRYPWLSYTALADRSGLLALEGGWSLDDLRAALDFKEQGDVLSLLAATMRPRAHFYAASETALPPVDEVLAPDHAHAHMHAQGNVQFVLVDVTAERQAYPTLLRARQLGAHVVMCNKWTLAEDTDRYEDFVAAGYGKVLCETTVGAALPVIGVLDNLLATGDTVRSIEAAISGTLGYVTTQIQQGVPFSEALREANRLGYTEPDPRDDLGGIDARRKALILARRLGRRLDMKDVKVESLVPPGLEAVSLDEFWRRLPEADEGYAGRVQEAASRGAVLRFLATIDGEGASVGLAEVPLDSLSGSLNGTESLFVFHTARYGDQPLAIRGRGAGADLTASGVLADILSLGG